MPEPHVHRERGRPAGQTPAARRGADGRPHGHHRPAPQFDSARFTTRHRVVVRMSSGVAASSRRKSSWARSPEPRGSIQPGSAPTSTASSTRTPRRVPESRHERGLLDTSVVIALPHTDRSQLPAEMSLSAITLAELVTGPHATDDVEERARWQDRLQRAQRTFDAVPFDVDAAQAHGRVYGEGKEGAWLAGHRPPHRGDGAGAGHPSVHLQSGGLPGPRQPDRDRAGRSGIGRAGSGNQPLSTRL